ncbi:MAG: hypothetical protein ACRD82_02000 [Blastocatellia bacterium]
MDLVRAASGLDCPGSYEKSAQKCCNEETAVLPSLQPAATAVMSLAPPVKRTAPVGSSEIQKSAELQEPAGMLVKKPSGMIFADMHPFEINWLLLLMIAAILGITALVLIGHRKNKSGPEEDSQIKNKGGPEEI